MQPTPRALALAQRVRRRSPICGMHCSRAAILRAPPTASSASRPWTTRLHAGAHSWRASARSRQAAAGVLEPPGTRRRARRLPMDRSISLGLPVPRAVPSTHADGGGFRGAGATRPPDHRRKQTWRAILRAGMCWCRRRATCAARSTTRGTHRQRAPGRTVVPQFLALCGRCRIRHDHHPPRRLAKRHAAAFGLGSSSAFRCPVRGRNVASRERRSMPALTGWTGSWRRRWARCARTSICRRRAPSRRCRT